MSWRGVVIALTFLAAVPPVSAQSRTVEGQVLVAADSGPPVPRRGQMVVLHRVGSDRAAPLDSTRTGAGGRFRFRYEATGSADALYFVSAMHAGVAYFSPPLRSATVRGGDADILVHDTTSDASSLHTQGRHLVVAQPRGTSRDIAEIFEIENPGPRTIVAADTVTPIWTTILPPEAESIAVAPGDVAASAVKFRSGRAELYAPLSPGVRQLVLTYLLPVDAFPVTVPVQRPLSVLEVLIEEPRAEVSGAGLAEGAPAPIEGRMFRRFIAQDVPASAVVTVNAPSPAGQNSAALRVLLVVLAAGMLGALGVWYARRRPRPAAVARGSAPTVPGGSEAERLIAELAALDARFERGGVDRATYDAERTALKARVASGFAARTVVGTSARTDRDTSARTDRDTSARTDRDTSARTDRDTSARTDRDTSA